MRDIDIAFPRSFFWQLWDMSPIKWCHVSQCFWTSVILLEDSHMIRPHLMPWNWHLVASISFDTFSRNMVSTQMGFRSLVSILSFTIYMASNSLDLQMACAHLSLNLSTSVLSNGPGGALVDITPCLRCFESIPTFRRLLLHELILGAVECWMEGFCQWL